jgi:hypothetical protein
MVNALLAADSLIDRTHQPLLEAITDGALMPSQDGDGAARTGLRDDRFGAMSMRSLCATAWPAMRFRRRLRHAPMSSPRFG